MSCLQYYILKILRYLGWIYGILEITTVIYLTDWYMVIFIEVHEYFFCFAHKGSWFLIELFVFVLLWLQDVL